MDLLEKYLKQATRGVYGTKKLEIQAELRGSVEARTWQLESLGKSSHEALETALLQMGKATNISAGLIKEHTMPKILKSTVLAMIFAAASLTVFTTSRAQIEVVIPPMSTEEYDLIPPIKERKLQVYYLSFSSIKENLEAAGITVDNTPIAPVQKSSAYKENTLPTLRFRFPGANKDTILQTAPGIDSIWKNNDGNLVQNSKPTSELSNDRIYMGFWMFVDQLRKTNLPIQIEGWRNPVFHIGATKLQIGSEKQGVTPWLMYSSIAGRAAKAGITNESGWGMLNIAQNHATRVNAPAGSVYAIVTTFDDPRLSDRKRIVSDQNMQHIDIARVGKDGILYFKAPHRVIEFVQSRETVFADRLNIDKKDYGDSKRPAKALLMRMNPDLTTTLELPAKTRSATIK
jgi:hypothetical protein